MRRLIILALCGLVAVGVAYGDEFETEIKKNEAQLQKLKREAEQKRRKARDFAKQERGVVERLKKVDEAIDATEAYLKKLNEREAILEADIRSTDRRLILARKNLDGRRTMLRSRLRTTYKHGKARSLEVLFSAKSFPELVQRSTFLGRLMQDEKSLVGEVEAEEAGIASSLQDLQSKREEVAALQQEKAAEKQSFEQLRAKREKDLAEVRGKRADHERAAAELERSAQKLKGILAELERKREERMRQKDPILAKLDRSDFSKNRGVLPWPVKGEVITEFGRSVHPKYKTVTLNNGIDIRAPEGAAVHAVGHGVVDVVKWLNGYGMSVILGNHGRGYYTIYSHLSAAHVVDGAEIEPGQVIGSVGDTGSLKGACLHFEVRQGSTARNPRQWLRR